MTEPASPSEPIQPEKSGGEDSRLQDLLSDLSFGPGWARGEKPVGPPISNRAGSDEPRRDRRPPRRGAPAGGRPPFRDKRSAGGDEKGFAKPRRDRFEEKSAPAPRLPVEISFIPDRDYLGAVVRQIHGTKRAYPLADLARRFLAKPEHHMIKVEARPAKDESGTSVQFFQDKESKAVFLSEAEWLDHVKSTHLLTRFDRIEQEMEAPAGNFTCVGLCKRSGTLLGPPNYHGYSERLLEVHRTRFPQIPLDEYRNSIEMVRDPALIEKWKESAKVQLRYREKEAGESGPLLTMTQAESLFAEKHASAFRHAGSKVIIPATAFSLIGDDRLKQSIQLARHREDRFPLSLMLALRPAFKHMRLHLFKAGGEETYVSPFVPKPMEAEHIIPAIKDMLDLISSNPGITKVAIAEKLHPGKSADDPAVAESLNPLVWLVDRGHVVEFFNGRLAIPGHWKNQEDPASAHASVLAVPASAPPPDNSEPPAPA